jgi:hypothetical protein
LELHCYPHLIKVYSHPIKVYSHLLWVDSHLRILSGSRTKNHTFELHCKGGSPICSYRETIKPDLTHTSGGIACVIIFFIAYALAMMEER